MRDRIRIGVGDYDHARDIGLRLQSAWNVSVEVDHVSPAKLFDIQLREMRWDVCEFSLALFCNLVSRGDRRLLGLAVFPSRRFRHDSIFVSHSSQATSFEQLANARIGIPEWCQTAGVWLRGLLSEEHAVDWRSIEWVQGGVNAAGRPVHTDPGLPAEVSLSTVTDRPLAAMLHSGELDAIMSAGAPDCVPRGCCRRLLADVVSSERDYWARRRVFPIMHVIVVRSELARERKELLKEVFDAFEASKQRSLERLAVTGPSLYPVPLLPELLEELKASFGEDLWPYGVDANKATLDAFLDQAWQQRITTRRLAISDVFAPAGPGPSAHPHQGNPVR